MLFAINDSYWDHSELIWILLALNIILLLWDVVIEGVSWYVALSEKFVPQIVIDSNANSNSNPNSNSNSNSNSEPGEKPPTAFGENRRPSLSGINDPGSVDQVAANVQYRFVYSEEVHVNITKPKNIWKREVSYLHPLLADEGEEDPDEEQLADTTKVATYEREYSRLFAVLLFPIVFASFSLHFLLIIGFPLAIRSFKRYFLAFDGYVVAHKEQRKLKSLTFLASRGLFLMPFSVWFFGLTFLSLLLFYLLVNFVLYLRLGLTMMFRGNTDRVQVH